MSGHGHGSSGSGGGDASLIPMEYLCPMSSTLMFDPVTGTFVHTFVLIAKPYPNPNHNSSPNSTSNPIQSYIATVTLSLPSPLTDFHNNATNQPCNVTAIIYYHHTVYVSYCLFSAADGITYERSSIEGWIKSMKRNGLLFRSPTTDKPLDNVNLIPNQVKQQPQPQPQPQPQQQP